MCYEASCCSMIQIYHILSSDLEYPIFWYDDSAKLLVISCSSSILGHLSYWISTMDLTYPGWHDSCSHYKRNTKNGNVMWIYKRYSL